MKTLAIINPLHYSDAFLRRAIELTYDYVCSELQAYYGALGHQFRKGVPTITAIENHLQPHFLQELYLDVLEREAFESVGADSLNDFRRKIEEGAYFRYLPDTITLEEYLEEMMFVYVDHRDCLRHSPVKEVW